MNTMQRRDFREPEQVREFPLGRLELVTLGGITFGRARFEPGWKWSTSVKPLVQTTSCEAPHLQYHLSGRLRGGVDPFPPSPFPRKGVISVRGLLPAPVLGSLPLRAAGRGCMDDGSEAEFGPGQASFLPPGHDAWVVGKEAVEVLDVSGMVDYAKTK